jgi:hypothetical protein
MHDPDARKRRVEVELVSLDARDEAAHREERVRARPAPEEGERVRHRTALREAAQHEPVVRQSVEELGQRGIAPRERLALGRADPAEHVPVCSSGR